MHRTQSFSACRIMDAFVDTQARPHARFPFARIDDFGAHGEPADPGRECWAREHTDRHSRVLDDATEHKGAQVVTRELRAVVDSLLAPPDDPSVIRGGIPIDPASTGRHAPPCSRSGDEYHASGCVRAPRFHQGAPMPAQRFFDKSRRRSGNEESGLGIRIPSIICVAVDRLDDGRSRTRGPGRPGSLSPAFDSLQPSILILVA